MSPDLEGGPRAARTPMIMLGVWLATTLALWGLAFAPGTGVTPEWLEAARHACFGTFKSGLPDMGGWIILVGAPILFLVAAAVIWGSELRSGFGALLGGWKGRAILIVALSTVAWEASWVTVGVRRGIAAANADFSAPASGELPTNYPRGGEPAPELSLVDQKGARVTLASLKGKTVLLTFAFAHCQTICPTIVHQSTAALEKLTDAELLIVTLDPWRDTPRSLPFLAERWKLRSNARVLSGDVPSVTAVLDRYRVPWKRDEKNGDIAHPALSYVIDPEGRLAYAFNNAPISWLVEAAKRVGERKLGVAWKE